jgi:hypothetical protein
MPAEQMSYREGSATTSVDMKSECTDQITSFFLLAKLGENLLHLLQVSQIHANPVNINVDPLLLPFRLDLGNGFVSLVLLSVFAMLRVKVVHEPRTAYLLSIITRAFCRARLRAISYPMPRAPPVDGEG